MASLPSMPPSMSRPYVGRRYESSPAEGTCAECGTDLHLGTGGTVGDSVSSVGMESSSAVDDQAEENQISSGERANQIEPSSLHMKVIDAFWRCFRSDQDDLALAAVHALGAIVRSSRATSVLQLFVHIRAASDALEAYARREDVLRYIGQLTSVKRLTTLPLRSACLLYQQFGLKHHERRPDISLEELRELLVAQSAKFASRILHSKQTIADIGMYTF
ncbi:eukaryotic initiation factor- alpha subunit [Cystoisospora suis]|uniref:Eukaryotic initiation factor-alpha subunit n=1 Tax=Cystoisospora suis TaxID=483139 RepID=A0A2C6LCI2_9APIC|nr:eukaryotic initiation factor- alpha subunit [Cystoisospora suis]